MGCTRSKIPLKQENLATPTKAGNGDVVTKQEDVKITLTKSEPANLEFGKSSKQEMDHFHKRYKMDKELGRGNYSVVKRGIDSQTNQVIAIKCITEKSLTEEDKTALKIETALLRQLDHPNIIKFLGFYQDDKMYYILTEFVGGGELFDRIVAKEFYSEGDAQKVVRTVAGALKYCHDRNVVHRDLKPENILLTSAEDDGDIKIADFGFAKQFSEDDRGLKTSCGTPGYVAPEILNGKKYGKEVDMWSLGVIIYILLCGYPPFHDDDQKRLFRQIRSGNYTFDEEYWSSVSETAKDLIRKLLIVDGSQRLSVEQLLQHPWLSGADAATELKPAQEQLRKYQARKRWRTGFNAITAANRLAGFSKSQSLDDKSSEGEKVEEKPASAISSS